MAKEKLTSLDYFVGGVPPYPIFELDAKNLRKLLAPLKGTERYSDSTTIEVSFIGAVSYFEAFFQNLFAALINIYPSLIYGFSNKRGQLTVNIVDVLKITKRFDYRVGSLLSENFDFGTAKSINSLFFDLIGVTPFSQKDSLAFSDILNDRNLLVHHGGTFTFKYHAQKLKDVSASEYVHWHSLVLDCESVIDKIEFMEKIALKTTKAANSKLLEKIKNDKSKTTKEQKSAINYLLWEG